MAGNPGEQKDETIASFIVHETAAERRRLLLCIQHVWFRGVVVKRAESSHERWEFESCSCHNENSIGEEDNGRLPHKIHFPRKKSGHCLWFLLHSKSSMQRRSRSEEERFVFTMFDGMVSSWSV